MARYGFWLIVGLIFFNGAQFTPVALAASSEAAYWPCTEVRGLDREASGRCIVDANLEASYITAGAGINSTIGRSGYGSWDDQVFEAELNHHLHWFNGPSWKNWRGFMKINPKIQLRMFNEESAPVRTPGFLPRATYFFWQEKERPENRFAYHSVMLSHHSNGQSGDFYNPDGTVNTESGNFSTNFFEVASYLYRYPDLPEWTKLAIVWHPGFNREDGLKNQYEEWKVEISARSSMRSLSALWSNAPAWLNPEEWRFKAFGSLAYTLLGRDYVVAPPPGGSSARTEKAEWHDNLQLSLSLAIRPPGFNDVNLFVKYDFGYDYYNINFQHEFNRVQIGLAADPYGVLSAFKKALPSE